MDKTKRESAIGKNNSKIEYHCFVVVVLLFVVCCFMRDDTEDCLFPPSDAVLKFFGLLLCTLHL